MVNWDGTVVLTTPRLLLRTFRLDDLPLYAALNADPEVYRYLGGEPLTREWSDEIAEWAQECYETEGIGLMAVERRSDGAFLGMAGVHHQESFPDELEVAWRLAFEYWGHGYATEAGEAWLAYAFETLGAERVISTTDRPNRAASRRCSASASPSTTRPRSWTTADIRRSHLRHHPRAVARPPGPRNVRSRLSVRRRRGAPPFVVLL